MYKLKIDNKNETTSILRIADGASIPLVKDNTDYQAYLKWVSEGGVPLPADE
jgi:hypothetical protein